MRRLLAGMDGQWRRDKQYHLMRIVTLACTDTFQRQQSLRFSIRQKRTDWGPRLTQHCELVLVGGPIIIENPLMVDHFARLPMLRPK